MSKKLNVEITKEMVERAIKQELTEKQWDVLSQHIELDFDDYLSYYLWEDYFANGGVEEAVDDYDWITNTMQNLKSS